jgi:hypothetical protein
LRLHQDRTDETGQGGIHRHRHAAAHDLHRRLHRCRIEIVERGDREQHQDEADDRAEQAELQQSVAGKGAELHRRPQFVGQSAQQQSLIEPPLAPLLFGLHDEVADVVGDAAGGQRAAVVGQDPPSLDAIAANPADDALADPVGGVDLARNHEDCGQAMRRDCRIKNAYER